MSDVPQPAEGARPTTAAGLSAEARSRLEEQLLRRSRPAQTIPRRPAGEPPALSFAQERIWLIEQLFPDTAAYNVTRLLSIGAEVELEALGGALDRLVARHEVLRTTVIVGESGPAARTLDDAHVELALIDLAAVAGTEREQRARQAVIEAARRPFDLTRDVLLRALLVRLAPEQHLLALVTHHMASDEGSRRLLVGELDRLYRAGLAGEPDGLPPLPLQYADFAAWQRQQAASGGGRELSYWRKRLAGVSAGLDLPVDRPRPARPSFRGARESATLPRDLLDQLRRVSREARATLFMTLVAGLVALLHRYSGQDDIAIGTPISARSRPELEELIGPFLNLLVLRVEADDDCTFHQLIDRVKETAVGAYAHQEVPFERLVQELLPDRDVARPPLFQAAFTLEASTTDEAMFAGVPVRIVGVDAGAAKYDLALIMAERPQGLQATLEFSTDLFEPASARRLLAHLETLLRAAAGAPGARLADLPLLARDEEQALRREWNDTRAAYPARCLHELVCEQAASTPDRIAVSAEDRSLSYAELERRSNRLARHLRTLGVARETLVGVCLERRAELIVALLGVLKAGGAYVPLDPAFPGDRLAQMLEDAAVEVLLTEEALAARLALDDQRLVLVDRDRPEIEGQAEAPPSFQDHSPEQLAYVIYTSGSTGRPKGVEIPHRALVNLLWSVRREPGLAEEDVLVAVTTVSFDIAGLELYLPLVCGARVELCPARTAQDPGALAELLERSGATVMQATPTTWRMLCEAGWPGREGLKCLCGGEAWPQALADTLLERGLQLWNMYGPTETTIWSTCGRLLPGEPLSLGRPLANTTVYVLDGRRRLVPAGVPGQLYIGGHGLARGYRGLPQLTAEKFVPDPFRSGERMYATGDLLRRRCDGSLEFLGRLDHQVKIRGFRVELGEVEVVLSRHQGVAACVCVARHDTPGEARLVAYLVPQGNAPAGSELRAYLAERLPGYMVPSAFVTLDRLPLTPNGKVDRGALPAPSPGRGASASSYRPAAGPLEEQVVRIWEEVLDVRPVGVDDDFFELGGHSLAAVRVAARLRSTLGLDVPLLALFEHATPAALAQQLSLRLLQAEAGELDALLDEVQLVAEGRQ